MRSSKHLAGFMVLLTALVLSACGGKNSSGGSSSASHLPGFIKDSPPRVQEAYQFAVDHPDELAKYPCYCGCGRMGHTSNLSCYIKNRAEDGTITYDDHASGCGLCVDITQDVIHMRDQGKAAPEIRTYIDAKYSQYGPSTNTPLPQE